MCSFSNLFISENSPNEFYTYANFIDMLQPGVGEQY